MPETKTATIEFKDVNHTYPARPDVQVCVSIDHSVALYMYIFLGFEECQL